MAGCAGDGAGEGSADSGRFLYAAAGRSALRRCERAGVHRDSQSGDAVAAAAQDDPGAGSGLPVAISSGNGLATTDRAMELMRQGTDTLDAAIAGVNIVELDPNDMSVGYGGLPNEEGVVELDSCVMHGPTYNAGSVAAIRGIKTPSKIAYLVMKRTDHVMLVGEGAQRFAQAHGYKLEDLLTEKARQRWLEWKESLSNKDDWLTPAEAEAPYRKRETGTITCLCLNDRRELSGVTTTSGLRPARLVFMVFLTSATDRN